jgi:hypothetical protein
VVDLSEGIGLPDEKLVLSFFLHDYLDSPHLLLVDLLAAPEDLPIGAYT